MRAQQTRLPTVTRSCDVLNKAGYSKSQIGTVAWTDPAEGAHQAPLYEWKK
jgi:hypothetical protein